MSSSRNSGSSLWFLIFCVLTGLYFISSFQNYRRYTRKPVETVRVNVNVVDAEASVSKALDLQALGSLAGKVRSGEELEEALNSPKEGLNNLDLNGDGAIDLLTVREFEENGQKGFTIIDPLPEGEVELARVEISRLSDTEGRVAVRGNPDYYGEQSYYHRRFGLGEFLLFSYLFRPHPLYYSPWGYGAYPRYYSYRSPVSASAYRSRTASRKTASGFQKSAAPRGTGKAFKSRTAGRAVGSGGFGRGANGPQTGRGTAQTGRSGNLGRTSRRFSPRSAFRQTRSGGFGRTSIRSFGGFRSGGFGGGGK